MRRRSTTEGVRRKVSVRTTCNTSEFWPRLSTCALSNGVPFPAFVVSLQTMFDRKITESIVVLVSCQVPLET